MTEQLLTTYNGVASLFGMLFGNYRSIVWCLQVIAYVGGTLFLVFAAATLVEIVR
jgi:hypothetical protein